MGRSPVRVELFVGGLGADVDELLVRDALGAVGRVVEVLVVRDPVTRRSRGYAFVALDAPAHPRPATLTGLTVAGFPAHVCTWPGKRPPVLQAPHRSDDGDEVDGTREGTGSDAPFQTEIIVGPADQPLVSIREATPDGRVARRREDVELPAMTRTGLASLLRQAPRVLVEGGATATSLTKLEMVFTAATASRLATGSLELTRSANMEGAVRAIAREASGKRRFVENANIVRRVDAKVAVAGIWQIASVVTAQHHLAGIETRLANIERGVSGIQGFLDDGVVGKLKADFEYLRTWAPLIRNGAIREAERPTIAGQIETIYRDAHGVSLSQIRQLERALHEAEAATWDDSWIDSDDRRAEAIRLVTRAAASAQWATASVKLRLAATSFRSALAFRDERTSEVIRAAGDDLQRCEGLWSEFDAVIERKLPTLKSFVGRASVDHGQQESVRRALGLATKTLDSDVQATRAALEAIRASDLAETDGVRVEVEVDADGEIQHAQRLLPPGASPNREPPPGSGAARNDAARAAAVAFFLIGAASKVAG